MDKNIMDTQELSEIRALIGDFDEPSQPAPQSQKARTTPQPPVQPQQSARKIAQRRPSEEWEDTELARPSRTAQRRQSEEEPQPRTAQRRQPMEEPQLRTVQRRQPAEEVQPRAAQRRQPMEEPQPRAAQRRQPAEEPQSRAAQRRQPEEEPQPRAAQRRQSVGEPQPRVSQRRQSAEDTQKLSVAGRQQSHAVRQAVPQPSAQRRPQKPPEEAYNLEDILSEVSGVVERGASERAQEAQRPRAQHIRREEQRGQPGKHPAEAPSHSAPHRPRLEVVRNEEEEDEEDEEEYEEFDEREERREAKRARKEAERERKRTAREAKRVSTEEDEEIVIRQPRQAQATCARRAKSLASRSIVVLLMAVVSLYLTLAGGLGLPLPTMLKFSESTTIAVLALLLTQFIAMFAGIDVIGLGFYNLFTGKPDRRSLVSAAQLASFLHSLTIIIVRAWNAYLPYCAVSIVLLYAMMTEEKNRLSARCRVFKAVSLSETPVLVYSHLDPDDRPRRAMKYQHSDNTAFLRELEKPDYAEQFGRIYVPIALGASIVFAAISAFGNQDPSRFFLAFSVMLSVAAPLGILCAAGKPYKNVSRRLLGDGAALAGARGANRLRSAKEVILNDADLFPTGSVTIESIHNFGMYTDEKLLAYAAAITDGEGLEIGRVFADALHRSYGRPVRAGRILRYESGGMSADIGGDSVMIGTAAFLARMGIQAKETAGVENGVFIVVNSYPAGLFDLKYHPSAQAYGGIHTLKRVGLTPVVAAMDFNISPAMVASLFELKQGSIDEVPSDRAEVYGNPQYVQGDPPGALLSRDNITPYANVFLCADKLAGVVRSNLILGGFAGVSGMLIMFYLTYLAEFSAISPQNILLYLLCWYLPVLFITYGTRKLD